jgi:Zn-dependent metalloprotease
MKRVKNCASARWMLIPVFIFSCFTAYAQTPRDGDEAVPPKLKSILTADSKNGWHRFADGITLDLANPTQFFEKYREAFELQDGYGMTLISHNEEKNLQMNHYRFQQTYKGIPIAGAEYILHHRQLDKGSQLKGNGTIIAGFSKDEKSVISGEGALQSALKQVSAKRYAWEDPTYEKMIKEQKGADATLYPQPRLVYYSIADDRDDLSSYHLAYELKVFAVDPMSHQQFYVSAENGDVIRTIRLIHETNTPATGTTKYNGVQSFVTDFTGSNYILKETNRNGSGTSISTYDMNNQENLVLAANYQNTSTTWQNEPVGAQGHWSAEKTFDYFFSVHGRNSFNNSGSEVIAYLDYGASYNNASWNGIFMKFGSGDGITKTSWASLDVVAHEFTHGVTEFSAGLIYLNESGALNESFSDIFGTAVEFSVEGSNGNWLVSEDVTINGAGIRSLSNPNVHSDPDTYQGTFWEFTSNDNGGVHTNSGVQNHWFYLLSQGGSGTNDKGKSFTVAGIGIEAASAIAYRNLTQYLTTDSRYRDAREGALEAAEDLYGRTSQAYAQTAMAWYAVGVGFPVYSGQDLQLRTVIAGGGSCNQLSLELVNLSTLTTIPSGAVIDVFVKENNITKPVEQVTLSAALAPGNSVTLTLSQTLSSTNGKIDIEARINYAPDPEPGNNIAKARILRGIMTIGGVNPDFANINLAVAALSELNTTICGHLDFKIRSGQYNGEVRIANITASSSSNTVTFQSETGNPDDVTLYSSITFGSAYGAISIERANGIRIKNLRIVRQVPSTISTAIAVAIRGEVHDLILDGNKFMCQGTSGPSRINVDFQPYSEPQSNITIRNNLMVAADIGVSGDGLNFTDNVLIENNTLSNHREPINMFGGNITIRNNKIFSNSVATSGSGVSVFASGEFLFEGNNLWVNPPASTNVIGVNIRQTTYAKVYNNMINVSSAGVSRGVLVATAPTAEFYHNTIRLSKLGTGTTELIAIDFSSSMTASAIWNNILTSITNGAVGIRLRGQDILSNGNDFHFPNNGGIGIQNAVKYSTLTLWQNATGLDMSSTTVQPLFASDNDLHLGSQQPNLRSTIFTILKNDIDGEVRFFFPNMGADDFFAPNTGDLGITGIRVVNQSTCDRKAVQIDIRNTGSIPYAAGMQIPVSHRVDGTSATTETVTLQQNFTVGQTITYTFIQPATFSPGQNHVLSGRIDRPDANLNNNTSVDLTTIGKSEFTVGGINPDFTTIKLGLDFMVAAVRPCPLPLIVFKIRPGVYTDPLSVVEIPGSSLRFESETGIKEDVTITSGSSSTVSLTGAKHTTFRNLTIQYLGTSTTEASVLVKNICEDITITNCNFSMPLVATEHYAIKAGPSLAPQLNGFRLTNNVFTNGGIKMESNANVSYPFDNIQIDSNTFINSYVHAVSLNRTGVVTVSDNNIISANVSSGISIILPQKDVRVERNDIRLDAGVNGIYFSNSLPSFSRIYVFNNLVNLKSGAATVTGITVDGKGGYLNHNTVKVSAGPVQPSQASALSSRNNGVAIRHNIFHNTITNGFGVDWSNASSSENWNDISVPNGFMGRKDAQTFSTLAAWQSATGADLQSTDVLPLFADVNDLHLATYQPELRGSNTFIFPFVYIDIDGDERSAPLYMGADEYIRPPFIELSENDIDVPLFGRSYSIAVSSNIDWMVVTPLPDGVIIDDVTSGHLIVTVNANPLSTPRDLFLTLQSTSAAPAVTTSLHFRQEGPPAITATPGNAMAVLTWPAATDSVMNYKIYSSEEGAPSTSLVAIVSGTTTTFTDTALTNGTTYVYQLSLVNFNGDESAKSAGVFVTPVNLPFLSLSPNDIPDVPLFGGSYLITVDSNIDWTIGSIPDGITVDQVTAERFVVNVSPNPLSMPRAFSLTIESSLTTANLRLQQEGPPSLTADGYDGMIVLSWPQILGATQYNLYILLRGRPRLLTTVTKSTTYTHTGLTNGFAYSYQVSAVDRLGNESALSNVATATPQRGILFREAHKSLAAYPNPVEDRLTLRGEIEASGFYIAAIFNAYAVPMLKQKVYLEEGEIQSELEVSTLSPGIYLLRLTDPSGNVLSTIRFEKK